MKLAVVILLALLVFGLVKCRLLQVDLSFPWFAALVVLGFASMNDSFINWAAATLGIVYAPIAIILIVLFILWGLVTVLAIGFSRLHQRQLMIVRHLAQIELDSQERARSVRHRY